MATAQEESKSEESEFNIPFQPVGGRLDVNRIYKWSEACAIRDTFIRMIVAHSADPKSWFSAYQIQKKSWANDNITVLDREKLLSMHFETYEQVIEFMERVFKAMGYEIVRRESFDLIRTVPPEYLLADADYMTSLLVSEYEWETALKYYQSGGKEHGPSIYKVMEDAMFTPQPQARRPPMVTQEIVEASQNDSVMNTVEASLSKPKLPAGLVGAAPIVRKTLDFDGVSSADTTPNTKPKPKKPLSYNENVAQGLLKLATDGDLSIDDVMQALRALKVPDASEETKAVAAIDTVASGVETGPDTDQEEAKVTKPNKSKKKTKEPKTMKKKSSQSSKKSKKRVSSDTDGSATDDTDRAHAKSTKKKQVRMQLDLSSDSSDSDELSSKRSSKKKTRARSDNDSSSSSSDSDDSDWGDSELFVQDLPARRKSRGGGSAAVMQNIQLRVFDGRNRSVEEATQWASKFVYAANMTNMTDQQRLEAFVNNIGGAVRFWWKQLPKRTRHNWKKTLKAFYKRYCRDALSVQRSYFKTFQRVDEKPVDYLYRLNAAAMKAGIDYEDDPKELSEHIELFFDTAIEKNLPSQLRYNKFQSVQELEKILIQHETTQAKNAKKSNPAPQPAAPKAEKPRVNVVEAPLGQPSPPPQNRPVQPQRPSQGSAGSGGGGATKEKCEKCMKVGHNAESCWRDVICEHCGRKGHPQTHCRRFYEHISTLRERVRNGELTAEQLLEQLN